MDDKELRDQFRSFTLRLKPTLVSVSKRLFRALCAKDSTMRPVPPRQKLIDDAGNILVGTIVVDGVTVVLDEELRDGGLGDGMTIKILGPHRFGYTEITD